MVKAKDVGDAKQVARAELLTEIERRHEVEAIQILLSTTGGRTFVRHILDFCGVFAMAPPDLNDRDRFEGRRDVGLLVRKECLTAAPDSFSLVENEFESSEDEERDG